MTTKNKPIRQRIQFAFNADADSAIGGIFQYLIKNRRFSSREGKRKGLDAMIAFYKPLAYQEGQVVSEGELRAIAQNSVEVLSRQIELICSTFSIEHPTAIALDLKTEIKQAIAEVLATESIRVYREPPEQLPANTIPQPRFVLELNASEGIGFDENALLGDLCSNAEAAA